jgi:predicted DNA-binding transcriptional regulator AlpA
MTKTAGHGPAARTPAHDHYLTEREFSERYHVSGRTAQRWRATGDGPAFVRLGLRRVAYRLSDCEAWAAARTFAHHAAELAASETAQRPTHVERRAAARPR